MAGYRLGKKAIKNKELAILGIVTTIVCLLGINEIMALFGCALLGLITYFIQKNKSKLNSIIPLVLFQASTPLKIGALKIFLTFLKVGAILYGSGYVLLLFLIQN